ncbi:MAG TPA: hypothetical protein VGQ83_40075 [Polyangia bacterium]|jgi:heme A synthase
MLRYRLTVAAAVATALQMVGGGLVVALNAAHHCGSLGQCLASGAVLHDAAAALQVLHRLGAIVVDALVIAVVVGVLRRGRGDRLRLELCLGALALLVAQMVVGGLMVALRLRSLVTSVAAINGLGLLGALTALCAVDWHERHGVQTRVVWDMARGRLGPAAWPLLVAAGVTAVLDALLRHSGAVEALGGATRHLAVHAEAAPALATAQVLLLARALSALALSALAGRFLWRAVHLQRLVVAATVAVGLIPADLVTALAPFAGAAPVWPIVAHWVVAALLVAIAVWATTTTELARPPERAERRSGLTLLGRAVANQR